MVVMQAAGVEVEQHTDAVALPAFFTVLLC
jgi:hypothetical protein